MKHQRKLCYDLEILYNKWSPFIISVVLIVYHIFNFILPYDLCWVEYLCLPSLFTSLHMYNSRATFKLCKAHRCMVNYVVANLLVTIIQHYWIIPYLNYYWFVFIMVGSLFTFGLATFYYIQEHDTDDN